MRIGWVTPSSLLLTSCNCAPQSVWPVQDIQAHPAHISSESWINNRDKRLWTMNTSVGFSSASDNNNVVHRSSVLETKLSVGGLWVGTAVAGWRPLLRKRSITHQLTDQGVARPRCYPKMLTNTLCQPSVKSCKCASHPCVGHTCSTIQSDKAPLAVALSNMQ